MSKELLQDIIEDFTPEKFVRFFREKNRSFAPRREDLPQYNDDDFKNGIKLGEIKFAQDEQMVVCSFQAGQPLSERSGKKAQYEKGKKILKDSQSDAGIFVFYDEQDNFRFSLIYANYLGKKRDWSAFRRFTYFVSKEYTNKTFLLQIGEEDFSTVEKIKEAFSVEKVTKAFYSDIANWYFWAVSKTEFPKDAEKEESGRNIAVIRMITRLIFIWFMKERGLIRQDLFNYKNISTLLKDLSPKNTQYYKAILQNLFFATLNTKIEDRKFRFGKSFQGKNKDYMDHGIYRYEDYYKNKEDMLVVFKDIPFLNGGLFDCLDRRTTDNGKNVEIRIDGFTDKEVGLSVPNQLFFSDEITVDLNKDYGTKNKKYKVRGLIDILSSYNFTIDENDPNDADVALDPELLGKVFENLLASFNPETATTARKQTGSFYTPREIVNYMVDESLIAYLSNALDSFGRHSREGGNPETGDGHQNTKEMDARLKTSGMTENKKEDARVRQLFVHTDEPHQFNPKEVDTLINAIDNAKILDPACGSGAFPMGILHKLVHALGKLDPDNSKWKELQKQKAIKETEEAFNIGNKEDRIKRLFDIDDAFENNSSDYGRKLYLIENCIFGVDIQPIAVQIAKLRFFISLLVDQNVTPKKENISIRPLPNLETKFVAANTLIGIERPAQGLLRNREIDRKEAELHRVRERHFTARTPKIKQQCIEDDKKIRAEISDLLKKDGFPAGVTEKLANWNPYDQNASAGFFDPEWMFDVHDGFDIVLGNPPWISLIGKHGIEDNINSKDLYLQLYEANTYMPNLYEFFLQKGLSLLIKSGLLCYIIPDRFGFNESFISLRRKVLSENSILQIIYRWKFETIIADTMTLLARRGFNPKNQIQISYRPQDVPLQTVQQTILNTGDVALRAYRNHAIKKLIEKIQMESSPLLNVAKSTSGFGGKSAKITATKTNKKQIPVIKGLSIQRYAIEKIFYFEFKNEYLSGRTRDTNKLGRKEKVLLRKTGDQIISAYDDSGMYPEQSLYFLYDVSQNIQPKYLLGLLNSKLISWYYLNYLVTNLDSTPQLKNYDLDAIPIAITKNQEPVVKVVNQILAAKQKDPNADTSALEKQIDEMVYALYGLTPEEIAIVEGGK